MTAKPKVVVFDYGSGNVHSASKALVRAGADVELTKDRAQAEAADGLVVPGVGAFGEVVEKLREARGNEIIGRRLAGGRAVLGICVGMQVMFTDGVEGVVADESGTQEAIPGLDEWPGTVEKLGAEVLPHMGWNTVEAPENGVLFNGIRDERFYFVHSYGVRKWNFDEQARYRSPLVTWSNYGGPFIAAIENGPLSATQFHPEKSGDAGIRLLTNWVQSLR